MIEFAEHLLMYHAIRGVGCVHAYTSLGQGLKHIPEE
jgi:hypothetical protein